jgi:hypothetical protein
METMKKLLLAAVAAASLAPCLSQAQPVDSCSAQVLRTVHVINSDLFFRAPGQIDSLTEMRRDRATGLTMYCSDNGACVPTRLIQQGELVQALRLTDCHVSRRVIRASDQTVVYALRSNDWTESSW